MVPKELLTRRVRVEQGVMTMKEYYALPRSLELESHHQMCNSFFKRTPFWGLSPLHGNPVSIYSAQLAGEIFSSEDKKNEGPNYSKNKRRSHLHLPVFRQNLLFKKKTLRLLITPRFRLEAKISSLYYKIRLAWFRFYC